MKKNYRSAKSLSIYFRVKNLANRLIKRFKSQDFFTLSNEKQEKFLARLNRLTSGLGVKHAFTAASLCLALGLQAQNFTELVGADNPFNGVSIGVGESKPDFIDLDNDGDLDLVSGESYGTLFTFQNNGSNTFTELTGTNNPFNSIDVGYFSKPTFSDLDEDGDLDLIVGNNEGQLFYFENNGSNVFTELTGSNNPFDGLSVEDYARPALTDLDEDGDLDLVIGSGQGTFNYFENNGSNVFTELTGADNPFDGIDIGYESNPIFSDLDGDGDTDLISGLYGINSSLFYFENNGSNVFTELRDANNPFDGIGVGLDYTSPSLVDLDLDGDIDLVIGSNQGTFNYFENNGILTGVSDNSSQTLTEASIYPNPASSSINISVDEAYQIFNIQGIEVSNGENTNGNLDISNLETGMYWIKTETTYTSFVKE